MNQAPIGIFDSGVGGLTVARAIIDQLPNESIIYLGDTANSPYGTKTIPEVRKLALEVMDQMVDMGVKMLVIACNSASSAVLRDARERYTEGRGIPVVEVIQPAVRKAVSTSKNGRVGVIGTSATISSKSYDDAFAAALDLKISTAACPDFVEFVERGETSGDNLLEVARSYLEPLKQKDIDTLVLGCTHYPLLSAAIGFVMGDGVNLVSSAEETAKDVFRVLTEHDLLAANNANPKHRFLATGKKQEFEILAKRFLGPEVLGVEEIERNSNVKTK
ncbi:MAG: glutamate racemase [Microbacteriaceae bacterium]|nr:glutamate racemase [Microbacteriaceae bacterium]MDR9443791.1 glutamate racemase [Microbacteriaceae bacterium]